MTRRWLQIVTLSVGLLVALGALASAGPERQALFARGVEALSRGAHDEAVDRFELMADQGFSHPDVSFNRAVAYVARARSSAARPGDLGRAAAALVETLRLAPDDTEAQRALDTIRQEIARRRARRGTSAIAERPALDRAVVGLLPENAWALVAALGSLLTTLGLGLRLFSMARRPRLTGAVLTGGGALVLVLAGSATAWAKHLRSTSTEGVVVVPEARLLDSAGRPIPAQAQEANEIPEGASVFVKSRGGPYWQVEWGSQDGFVAAGQIRLVERR